MSNLDRKSGFTIVESLIAITILVLAITGTTTAIQTGLSSYLFSKNQIIAFYLAQEGLEQIKNIRDENGLMNNTHWLTNIAKNPPDPCDFGKVCTVDPVNSNVPIYCGADDECEYLRQDAITGFYGYDNNDPLTNFKREITLTEISDDEVVVTVTIDWTKGLTSRQFKVTGSLFDWQ